MPTKQITGVGPLKADGTMLLFTVDPRPVVVTAEWLAAQSSHPAFGDELQYDSHDGPYTLVPKEKPAVEEPAPKKEDGLSEPAPAPKPSLVLASGVKPPKPATNSFVALPTQVDAYTIVSVGEYRNEDHALPLALSNGENVIATKEMLARYMPVAGDYWVIQPDGYIYLNPKDVFERKYAPAPVR